MTDNLDPVDPELRAALALYQAATVDMRAASDADFPLALRARADSKILPPLAEPPVRLVHAPGTGGAPDVPIYLINADPARPRPLIVHLHGGGFISGTAAGRVPMMQELALATGCAVAAVEYRLAPETTGEGSLADDYAALVWLHGNAKALGIDPGRIALHGDSAGGGHAVLLARLALDRGEVPLAFLALTYPMLDDRTGSVTPAAPHTGQFVWTERFNRIGWRAFLGAEPGAGGAGDVLVPARIGQLADFPPTFLAVGDLDLFVEEDLAFALRLVRAGVPLELMVVPGGFHGFEVFNPDAAISRAYRAALQGALVRALGPA